MKKQRRSCFDSSRREFLATTLELAALCSQASLLGATRAFGQSGSTGGLKFFVNLSISGGLCSLGSYLSPTAKVANLGSLSESYQFPGYATAVAPSSVSNAGVERVLSNQPLFLVRTPVGSGLNSYQMPILWETLVPTNDGGTTSMKSLIEEECILLYGLESNPAHPLAAVMSLDPSPGGRTVGGYIANQHPLLIQAIVGSNGIKNFRSRQGTSVGNGGDDASAITELLKPYLPVCQLEDNGYNPMIQNECGNPSRRRWFLALREPMNRALLAMQNHHGPKLPSIEIAYSMAAQARLIVDQNSYAACVDEFLEASNRYLSLIHRLNGDPGGGIPTWFSTRLAGLTANGAGNTSISQESVRKVGNSISFSKPGELLSRATALDSLAYRFALIEVAIKKGLSSVLQMGLGDSLLLNYVQDQAPGVIQSDAHLLGALPNLCGAAALYTTINTLLLELKRSLIAAGLWNQTLIQLSTEFSRSQKPAGTGSDHNYEGAFSALFSGSIERFRIYGATRRSSDPNYPGYGGEGASGMTIGGNRLGFKDLGTSIANLYFQGSSLPSDLENLNQRYKAILKMENGKIVGTSNIPLLGAPEGG